MPIQLGGGIRDLDTIERYLDDGITWIVIGMAAVKAPASCTKPATPFPATSSSRSMPRDGKVATDGWSNSPGTT